MSRSWKLLVMSGLLHFHKGCWHGHRAFQIFSPSYWPQDRTSNPEGPTSKTFSHTGEAVPGFSLCIFSSLTCPRNLFSAKGDLLQWKVPPARLYWDLLTSGRYQPACVTVSKKWKNPSSALLYVGKGPEYKPLRTWVQALPWFSTCSLDLLPAWGTDLKSWKGLYYSGPSPIQNLLPHLKEKRSSRPRSLLFVGLVSDARYTKRISE